MRVVGSDMQRRCTRANPAGVLRVRFARGWVSERTGGGELILERSTQTVAKVRCSARVGPLVSAVAATSAAASLLTWSVTKHSLQHCARFPVC